MTRGQRALDVAITLLLLPFALAVGALIALGVYLDSPGPVLYGSRRVGRGGRPFTMLKFRKMRREAHGPALTSGNDVRFTPIGQFLTATRLDELPQLWNVLKGEMRLVGPRPEVEEFVELHRDAYEEILSVVPGLTGPAQLEFVHEGALLAGEHDPVAFYSERILPRKIELDLRYVRERNVLRDLRVIAATLALPLTLVAARLHFARARAGRRGMVRWSLVAASALLVMLTFAAQAGSLR